MSTEAEVAVSAAFARAAIAHVVSSALFAAVIGMSGGPVVVSSPAAAASAPAI